MKKLILLIMPFFLFGCEMTKDLDNTPTKKVEEYLNKYQTADESVLEDITLPEDYTYDEEETNRYKDIFKMHYGNMTYEIKNETIDGNEANVEVEVTVVDTSKILNEVEKAREEEEEKFRNEEGTFDYTLFKKYQLDELEKGNEKVTYTLNLSLSKENNEWTLNTLSREEKQKLSGTYE